MTTITRSIRRETCAMIQGRALMIEVGRHSIGVRLKGKRTSYSVPIEALYSLGAKIARREADALKPKKQRRPK